MRSTGSDKFTTPAVADTRGVTGGDSILTVVSWPEGYYEEVTRSSRAHHLP